ncbi:MAG TPA: FeoA family protein [Terriglobales bacterium]|nr:FeoA family protein [Terriglobales bacterium]
MIFNFKKTTPVLPPRRLADLAPGQTAVIAGLALAPDTAESLMDLGLVAGSRVLAVRRAPGGDPVVYRVDGAEIALRRETTRHISVLPVDEAAEVCP